MTEQQVREERLVHFDATEGSRTIRLLILAVGLLGLPPQPARAQDEFADPGIADEVVAVYEIDRKGGERATSRASFARTAAMGIDLYRLRFQDSPGPRTEVILFTGNLRPLLVAQWEEQGPVFRIRYSDRLAEIRVCEERFDKTRKAIPLVLRKLLGLLEGPGREKADVSPDGGQGEPRPVKDSVRLDPEMQNRLLEHVAGDGVVTDLGAPQRIPTVRDLYAVQSLPLLLLGFPFESVKEMSFTLSYLPQPPVVWKMRATLQGVETVTVPAGSFECYKIKLQTREWFSRFAFGDNTFFWIRKDQPRVLVRYTFPFAGETSSLVSLGNP